MTGGMAKAIAAGLALAGAFSGRAAADSASEGWTTYVNARFGTRADYPSKVLSVTAEPPENGDGQTFLTPDGRASLSIYGAWHMESDTPKSTQDRVAPPKDPNAPYVVKTARMLVWSGVENGVITYRRCNYPVRSPNGVDDCFSLTYPASEKQQWDAIVARISRSLRGGKVYYGR